MSMKDLIFKVKIDNHKRQRLEKIIKGTLKKGRNFSKLPICFATINPEILLKARDNSEYRKILNEFDLRIVDGFGITLYSFLFGRGIKHRTPGADLARIILEEGMQNKLRISFIINKEGLSSKKELILFLEKEFGKKRLCNCEIYATNKDVQGRLKIRKDTQVLFVGLGAPKQEMLIQGIKDKLPELRMAIGVGGTFDYWTNKRKRAPKIMRKLGFEWLWRLLILRGYTMKKARIKRVLEATFRFPLKYILDKSE